MIHTVFSDVLAPIAAFFVHRAPTSQNTAWVPGLMLLVAFLMFLEFPRSKNVSARKIVQWGVVLPMLASGSIVTYFVTSEGYPISVDLIRLGVVLFLLFVMSTMAAFIPHAVPKLLADKWFQSTRKQQPTTLAVFTLTLIVLAAMSMEVITH